MRALLIRYRRVWNLLLLAASLLGLYAAIGFVLLPHLAAQYASRYVHDALGRQLSIAELRFDPFRCRVELKGLALREADGTPLLALREAVLDADLLRSAWRREITLRELRLLGPDINLVVAADGRINLAQLVPPSSEPPPQSTAPPPPVHIGQLMIDEGRLAFSDHSRAEVFRTTFAPIRFSLANFRTAPGATSALAFSAVSAADERIEWNGDIGVQPLGSTGTFRVQNLQLRTIDDYLQDQLPVRLANGSLDLDGQYRLQLQPKLGLELELPQTTLRALAINTRRSRGDSGPIAVRELGVAGVKLSLEPRKVEVQTVTLSGVQLDLQRRADGSFNLAQLVTPAPAASAAPAAATKPPAEAAAANDSVAAAAEAPWQIAVQRIELADSALRFEDRSVSPAARFTLAPLALRIDGYHSGKDAVLQLDARTGINQSGRLQARGELRLDPLSTAMDLTLGDIALPAVQPYLSPHTTLQLDRGALSAKLRLSYGAAQTPQLRVAGDIGVAQLVTRDRPKGAPLLRWQQLDLKNLAYTQAPDRLEIERIALRGPQARVVIDAERKLNLTQLTPAAPSPAAKPSATAAGPANPPAAAASAKPPMPIRIGSLRVDGGVLDFADRSIEPSFAATIVQLGGGISSISSTPGTRSSIDLKGSLDRYAPVTISGSAALLDPTAHTDLRLSFRNIELAVFNPYSGKFAGYNIAKGKLTTELGYTIEQRQLSAEHHVVIDQLEFGEKTDSKDAAPLPVKLAAALLKDRHGVIDLQLPVRGSLDDPEFKYGALVWKVLGNTLSKIVSAPFAALGRLFGGGEELAYVDFAPGSATLDADQQAKLGKLAQALIERPQLKLDIPVTQAADDAEGLAAAAVQARLPQLAVEDTARLRAMEKLYAELYRSAIRYPAAAKTVPEQLAFITPALRSALAATPPQLEALAQQRAQAVQAALLAHSEIAAERIFITAGRAAVMHDARVRMELKLQ